MGSTATNILYLYNLTSSTSSEFNNLSISQPLTAASTSNFETRNYLSVNPEQSSSSGQQKNLFPNRSAANGVPNGDGWGAADTFTFGGGSNTNISIYDLTTDNTVDGVDLYTPYSERPETYIIPIVFAIIFVVGVLGNGTLVITFMRHRAMRNIPNT